MKKNIIALALVMISVVSFGQSVLLEPGTASKRFVVKSTGTTYGHFSTTGSFGADLYFKNSATGDGNTGTDMGSISTFADRIHLGGSLSSQLSLGSNGQERIRLALDGKVGIGTVSPNYNLQLHNPSTGSSSILQLTNETIGTTSTDGLYIGENNSGNASIFNQENAFLGIGTNGATFLQLAPTLKACLSCLTPAGKFDIWHNTGNTATNPHITLKTTVDASNGMIRMENSTATRYFGQYFNLSSATAANNFVSFDYGGTTPILDLQGNGNVKVSGFTTLGDDVAAPKIKIKKITSTTSASQGGNVSIPHGVSSSKIIAINVLVRYNGSAAEAWVGNGYTGVTGYEFSYQYDGSNIFITNSPGNSANILSKDIKIVVTYEE
ncbi:hypothetical protein GCM10011514_54530 [Emticicia aquatilis]|uniref:Uncharacterized protein n=1 Tax=Emticicia aquatilis TaxID=1537369 RepID=A0A916ZAA0_9BACT|nr:hypothetical protein [Emticicia aquatilis]GGD83545.1 hypothetical protein GCM10011514_54530 [Emticicia aquatilis]